MTTFDLKLIFLRHGRELLYNHPRDYQTRYFLVTNGLIQDTIRLQEAMVLLSLFCKRIVTKDDLIEAVWPDYEDFPYSWRVSLNAVICRLNKIIRPLGHEVKIVAQERYTLTKRRDWIKIRT